MRLIVDCKKQFDDIITKKINEQIVALFPEEVFKLFSTFYALNYLTNRIEVGHHFESKYYKITHSCLLESYQLLLDNHPRGSSLVCRSGLENFIKHLIENNNPNGLHKIDDRVYINNKNTLDRIVKEKFESPIQPILLTLNEQLLTMYKQLSGLSHSLVPQSENNIVNYFSDIQIVNKHNIDQVLNKYLSFFTYLFDFCVLITHKSLKEWDAAHLKDLLSLVYGNKKRNRMSHIIKQNNVLIQAPLN